MHLSYRCLRKFEGHSIFSKKLIQLLRQYIKEEIVTLTNLLRDITLSYFKSDLTRFKKYINAINIDLINVTSFNCYQVYRYFK